MNLFLGSHESEAWERRAAGNGRPARTPEVAGFTDCTPRDGRGDGERVPRRHDTQGVGNRRGDGTGHPPRHPGAPPPAGAAQAGAHGVRYVGSGREYALARLGQRRGPLTQQQIDQVKSAPTRYLFTGEAFTGDDSDAADLVALWRGLRWRAGRLIGRVNWGIAGFVGGVAGLLGGVWIATLWLLWDAITR